MLKYRKAFIPKSVSTTFLLIVRSYRYHIFIQVINREKKRFSDGPPPDFSESIPLEGVELYSHDHLLHQLLNCLDLSKLQLN